MKKSTVVWLSVGGVALAGLLYFKWKTIWKYAKLPITTAIDAINSIYLQNLNPVAKSVFTKFLILAKEKGYQPIITTGYRDYAYQAKLYAENNNNAAPGYSLHEFGLVIDVMFEKDAVTYRKSTPSKAEWEATGIPALAKSLGLTWGGDFISYEGGDRVHFALPVKTISELRSMAIAKYGSMDKAQGNKLTLV